MKSQYHTNFSVNIDCEDKPMMYQCFRADCQAKGSVDQEFIKLLGSSDYSIIRNVNKHNRKLNHIRKDQSSGSLHLKYKKELKNVITTRNDLAEAKLNYLSKRIGVPLTYEDVYKLKINLNFLELLDFNEVTFSSKKYYKYNRFNVYGISFLSAYNDYAIIRDITKSLKLGRRYTNENIFDNYANVCKYYVIPTQIDLLSTEPIVLNVSEGAFDILSVYYNLDIDSEYSNHIYAAACGAGITNTIMHYIKTYGLLNVKINIFSDNDQKKKNYNGLYKLKQYLEDFNITIYYNVFEGEKDFGVPKDRIEMISSNL